MIAVVKQKHRAVNPLAGSLVHLVEQNTRRFVIGDLQRGRLTVLDLNTVGRGIQQVAGRSFQLRHSVPAAFGFGEIDDTVAVRCVGADDLTIHLADFELDTRNTLATVFVALDNLQPAHRRVVKIKRLRVVGIDHDSLRASVFINGVTGDRFNLCDHHGAGNTGNGDFTRLIRPVQAGGGQRAALGIYIRAICVGDLKLDAFQRLLCNGVLLYDDEIALGGVAELHRDNFIGLDLDCLRGIVENVAVLRAGFLDDKRGAGSDVRNGESACAVRHIFAVGVADEIAVRIRDKELHIGDGSVRHSVYLFHQNAAPGLVAELQRHHGIAFDFDALRRIVQDVAILGTHFFCDDRHAGGQAINADGARAIGHIFAVGVADHAAIRIGDEELHIGNGGAGHGVLFYDQEGTHLIVAKGHGNDVLILAGEIDRFRGVGDHIPVRSRNFLADVSACFEAGHNNGAIARSAVLTDDRAACTGGAAEVADSKPCTFQRLTALAVHLADDDGGKRRVLKGQDFALTTGNEAFLRGRLLDGIPGRRFQFRYFVPAILDLGENDFSACVRKVSAEVVELAGVGMVAAIPDLELGTLDRIAGDTVYLADLQAGLEGVEEGDGRGFAGLQCHFLRDGAENDMVGNIDLRYFECANRNRVEENPPMVIGRGAGRKAAVDLLDTVGHALDGLTIGDVLLDNFKTGLFIVNESDLGGLAGAQRHGLLGIGYDVRLGNGFLTHNIDTGRNGRERCGTVRPGRDGGGIAAGNRLHRKYRADNRFAAHGVALDDLHIGLFIVDRRNGVFAVALGHIYIDAFGRGINTEAVRCSGFHEAPKAGGSVLNIDLALCIGDVAADDLTVKVDAETGTGEAGCGSTGGFFQHDLARAARRLLGLVGRRLARHELARSIVVEE